MQQQKAYGFIHCHSEHSLKDSPLKIEDLCRRAKEMGAVALSLTDHGTCTGIIEFIDTCRKYGLRPIPGVEAYVESYASNRAHLILLAKNYEGYQEISQAITEANENLENVGGNMLPIMTKDVIARNFQHGNVIATSACMAGVISSILLGNQELHRDIEKIKRKQKKYIHPDDPEYVAARKQWDELVHEIERVTEERNVLDALAKKAYKKRLNALEAMKRTLDGNEYNIYLNASRKLKEEMDESKSAEQKLPLVKETLVRLTKKRTALNRSLKKYKESADSFLSQQELIDELSHKLKSEKELSEMAREEAIWFRNAFQGNFFLELQYHGIPEEKEVMPILARMSKELAIPVIATNDVHIMNREQAQARQFMCSMRFNTWKEISASDQELYMKSDQELYDALCKILDEDTVKLAIYNIRRVCDACSFEMPPDSHYPKYRDENGIPVEDSAALLRQKALEGVKRLYPDHFAYKDRLEYELRTIIELGYADYLLIVADFINYAKKISCSLHESGIGYGVGPGRGSGAGCLVNYLLGITSVDPMKYGLIFERFLNKDRVSMPDIDTDFSDEVREKTIEYVRKKYGEECVAGIRTCMTQAAKGSIKNSARLLGSELYPSSDDPKMKELAEQKKREIAALGETICSDIPQNSSINAEDVKNMLSTKYTSKNAVTIISRAQAVEGIMTGIGVHAAGIIIGDGTPLKRYVPLLYNTKKNTWVVQCDMVEAESIGLLKMDFLGLKNLDIITEAIRRIKKNTGMTINPNNLPFEQEVFREIFSKGKTNCVFQFESGGMKQMLQEFQPESFEDIILLVAAYRPGPMDFIPDIIDVKHNRKKPEYIIPELEEILSSTYGYPIYQEQLMDIFHKCAGFSLGESDIIRRYMSKKKVDKFLAYKDQFVNGLISHGATAAGANEFWESLVGFSKYAFNKSHAACYALVAYATAWLKFHYPVEYMCSVLSHVDKPKKIPALLYECRELGIQVLPPDINRSSCDFQDSRNSIIYGLTAIKGISAWANVIIDERNRNGYYQSFKDFLLRLSKNSTAIKNLIKSGAFDSFQEGSRNALLNVTEKGIKIADNISKKKKLAAEIQDVIQQERDPKEKEKRKKKYKSTLESIERYKMQMNDLKVPVSLVDDKLAMLEEEKELLGAYVSGHPLDSYQSVFKGKDICLINDFQTGFHWFAGLIDNVRIAHRKADGKEMAFFDLEDPTGRIQVCCFTEAYEKYHSLIEEGKVIKIFAKGVEEENESNDEDSEPICKLFVKKIFSCKSSKAPILMSVPDIGAFKNDICKKLSFFIDENEHPVYLHDQSNGNVVEQNFYLKSDVLNTEIPGVYFYLLNFI